MAKRIECIRFLPFLPIHKINDLNWLTKRYSNNLTSPNPFSWHHSARVPRRISPLTRKSNGIGVDKDRALFMSCES